MASVDDEATATAIAAHLARPRSGTALDLVRTTSQDISSTSGLPGFEPAMIRTMMGAVGWGNLKVAEDTRRMEDADAHEPSGVAEAFYRVHAEQPQGFQLRGLSSVHLDDQRLLVRRTTGGVGNRGEHIVDRLSVGVKRVPVKLHDESAGSLGELMLNDGLTQKVFCFCIEYENPSLASANPNNNKVALARLRLVVPPPDYGITRDLIRHYREHRHELKMPEDFTTVIGAWHDFDRWQPGHQQKSPYSVDFVDYELDLLKEPEDMTLIERDRAQVRAEVLKDTTPYGDRLMWMGISSLGSDVEKPPQIAFTIPASMTFSGGR